MKRLLCVVLAALSIPACASPTKVSYWNGIPFDNRSGFAERLLAAHNAERLRLGHPPVAWSQRLAADAQGWADRLAASGAFEHAPIQLRVGEGENLFTGTSGAFPLEQMIGGFVGERADFKPGVFPDVSRKGDWHEVGHYTQLIWRNTTEVGCALATGHGRDTLVCRYSPPGNVVGQMVP
ncbi:MAG: SCP-like extracellular [Novosphingobium sp.]|nr:SCP-like extracellular [Novosphingobium sp.]